jgi:hypothetical protein
VAAGCATGAGAGADADTDAGGRLSACRERAAWAPLWRRRAGPDMEGWAADIPISFHQFPATAPWPARVVWDDEGPTLD